MEKISYSKPEEWTAATAPQTLELIAQGKIDTTPLITHTYPLREIEAAYDLFEHRREGVIKVAIIP